MPIPGKEAQRRKTRGGKKKQMTATESEQKPIAGDASIFNTCGLSHCSSCYEKKKHFTFVVSADAAAPAPAPATTNNNNSSNNMSNKKGKRDAARPFVRISTIALHTKRAR
jgi:type IV secretory pathway VirJ component